MGMRWHFTVVFSLISPVKLSVTAIFLFPISDQTPALLGGFLSKKV